MAISIDWTTRIITIPKADLTLVAGTLYELDVDAFRLELKDIEDSEEGMGFPDTHEHFTEITLSGVTYARTLRIINGYTVEFELSGGQYTVRCAGANHNIADVLVLNGTGIVIGNSAGLILGAGSTAPTVEEIRTEMDANSDKLISIENKAKLIPGLL